MSFSSVLSKFANKSLQESDKVRRGAIIELLSGVVNDTPVLTGRAKGNWQTTVSKPAEGSLERLDKDGSSTIAAESQNLGKLGDTVFITNNLPYIKKLNDGSSSKAPAKFVEANVMRVASNLKKRGFIR